MSHTINRLYATHEQAAKAVAALEDADYSDIHLVPGASPGTSIDDIVASITRGNVLKSDAKILAKGVSQGRSLVTVHAPFGGAFGANRILDKFSPVASGLAEPEHPALAWDEATPISSILQIPVLLDDSATFSKFWNVAPLTSGSFSLSSLFGIPLLSRASGTFESSIGLPLLINNPAPLSSLLKLPTVSGSAR
jgi:hypothetical protein